MADLKPQSSGTGLTIPADTQAKFGAMIALIEGSESMNDEERQYWINILPIMTPEQRKNLEEILTTEKEQLAAIDRKYAKEIKSVGEAATVADIGKKIRSRRQEREATEHAAEQGETDSESEILEKIRSL